MYLLPLPLYSKSRAYHQQLATQRCNVPKQHSTIPAYPQVPSCQCMVCYSPKPCTTRRICLAEWPSRYVSPFPFPLFPQHAIPVRHPVGSGGQPIFCPRRWRSWVRMTRNTLFGGLRQRYTVYCYCSLLRCLCCMGWISLLHGLEV
jgi:hypothetical protein